MTVGQIYCKQIRRQFTGLHANFPPNAPLALGDYGYVRDDVFERKGNIGTLGLAFSEADGAPVSSFQFKTPGSVDVEFVSKGEERSSGVAALRASLEAHFRHKDSLFFNAAGCTVSQIFDVEALGGEIIGLLHNCAWDTDCYVVTSLVNANSTTVLVASGDDCEVTLDATSDAVHEIDMDDASVGLRVKLSRGAAFEIATSNPGTPLMQLSRVRSLFQGRFQFAPDEPSPLLAALATPAEQPGEDALSIQSLPTNFDIQRAIDAYIPLLQACYKLAKAEPFTLPAGYTQLGEVRVGVSVADLEVALTEEQRRAVEHDEEAMANVTRAGDMELAAIADPDAFGLIVREDATGSVLVCIRGTQTPAEWLADFSVVPIPFRAVPGFGLVHVGFEVLQRKIRESIRAVLATLSDDTRVTVVGHSLGAGMGVLGAVDIRRNMGKQQVDVCTFGGPRPGKIQFRVHFNREIKDCFRVVNQLDLVPHLPSVLTLWNHVGSGIHVNGKAPGSSAHSLEAHLDGLLKLQADGGAVMSVRVP